MTVIIYEVFYFFEGIYFRKPLKSECLILEIYSKYNPVNARRRFNVDTTSYDVVRRLIDVETTLCVYREPLSNLLNGVSYFSFTSSFKKWAKEKRRDTFLRNKKEKQNIATIMKSVNGKRNSFSNEAEITRESFE